MNTYSRESGAVMLYILIAVALVAALTAIMSRGSRTSESTLTDQQIKVAAQEVVEYASAIAGAIQKMRLRGCKDTEISMGNELFKTRAGALTSPPGHNPNAPTSGICDLFLPAGGGVIPRAMRPPAARTYANPVPSGFGGEGEGGLFTIQSVGMGTTAPELFYIIGFIDVDVCKKINDMLGVENPGGTPPEDEATAANTNKYNGTYTGTAVVGDEVTALRGKNAFCKLAGATLNPKEYHFYQVVIAR